MAAAEARILNDGSALTQLRSSTHELHLDLHRTDPFRAIAHGRFCRQDVRDFATIHQTCWSSVLAATASDHTAMLFASFDRPGGGFDPPGDRTLSPLARETLASCVRDDASLAGCAYVYLGSKKGGRLLARRLRDAGHDDVASAADETLADQRAWQYLSRDILPSISAREIASLIAGAQACFRFYAMAAFCLRSQRTRFGPEIVDAPTTG